MENEENKIFSETEKTVLFLHHAMCLNIDETITKDATYIKPFLEEGSEEGKNIFYYIQEMRNAAHSEKKYIIMEYEPIIGATIEALMTAPEQYNFCNWLFLTFFHADTCPPKEVPNPMYNTNDEKMDILWRLFNYPFILKYTIPVEHTLTATDILYLKKDFKGPETEEEFKEFIRIMKDGKKPKKQSFPYYEIDTIKLKAYIDKQK